VLVHSHPIANYGSMTVFYKLCELTAPKFTTWKTQVVFTIHLDQLHLFMNFIGD
jgi:hypothetical protein